MSRHRFRPRFEGSELCRDCVDIREAPTHYTGWVWLFGEVFEWGWGLLWIAIALGTLVYFLIR